MLTADWDEEAAEKGGYPHFMLKEIHERPAAITATVSPRVEDGMPDLRIPELSDEAAQGIRNIHLVACGTAMHAGMVGKTAIERLARVPAEVDIASEFRYRDPILDPDDLVIIISQSGETSDTLAALHLAKSRGVPVLAVVNVVGSSIARADLRPLHLRRPGDRRGVHQSLYGAALHPLPLRVPSGLRQRPSEWRQRPAA